jgi:hypothetical protein
MRGNGLRGRWMGLADWNVEMFVFMRVDGRVGFEIDLAKMFWVGMGERGREGGREGWMEEGGKKKE